MKALPAPVPPVGMSLAGRSVGVFGMARSGLACAEFLARHGARVAIFDQSPPEKLADALQQLAHLPVQAIAGLDDWAQVPPLDLLVVSPGVPADHLYLSAARFAGVEVIGEVELAWRFCAAPIAAVAGTNGKGSTTTLLGEMLTAAGLRCIVAGNIGLPLISVVEQEWDIVVAEVSSFQLETIVGFHPWAGILLNITPDHLSRHGTFDAYMDAKARLFTCQNDDDIAVCNADDPAARKVGATLWGQTLWVSLADAQANGYLQDDKLVVRLPDTEAVAVCHREDLTLSGDHYVIDALCAAVVARAAGCSPEAIQQGVRVWRPAAHLLTAVADVDGVSFLDDSKATNPAAAAADLRSCSGQVLVIAGGLGKGTPFDDFADAIVEKCAGAFLIGEAAQEIGALLAGRVPVTYCDSLEEAVQQAGMQAQAGGTVILCPACASFDQFRDQADRGQRFAAAAHALGRAGGPRP